MEEWDVVDCVQAEKLIHERLHEFRLNLKESILKLHTK
ncbi:hypothetical protein JCM19238_5512 [Vibrio ponticus]|nr:hypothetical protein JCM19238_5512 [Vibrio ponticus]